MWNISLVYLSNKLEWHFFIIPYSIFSPDNAFFWVLCWHQIAWLIVKALSLHEVNSQRLEMVYSIFTASITITQTSIAHSYYYSIFHCLKAFHRSTLVVSHDSGSQTTHTHIYIYFPTDHVMCISIFLRAKWNILENSNRFPIKWINSFMLT